MNSDGQHQTESHDIMTTFPPLEDLIPHRDHMKLVGEILSADDKSAVTVSVVRQDWPLVSETGADPLVMIETAAQTAAVAIGWKDARETRAGGGWLVGVKSAEFSVDRVPVGSRIITRAVVAFSLDQYTEIEAECRCGGAPAAAIRLQVMQAGDDTASRGDPA
ncbi:MAG: hypothetical protein CSB33_01335 [Desulfobacterales bacterium]|nr:MAG: hypothetical protein CSB33_01335 [Desulfobacterales bacterium]